jgi:hypothetical protein
MQPKCAVQCKSNNDYMNLIIRPVCSMEEQFGLWIERVPSQPNPADELSRERPVRFRGLMPMVVNMEAMWRKCLEERMRSASSLWE